MPGTTPNRSLGYPLGTDVEANFPVTAQSVVLALDKDLAYTEGIATARPSANTVPVGTCYRATDTNAFSVSTGTTWVLIGGGQITGSMLSSTAGIVGGQLASATVTDGNLASPNNGVRRTVFQAQGWLGGSGAGIAWGASTDFALAGGNVIASGAALTSAAFPPIWNGDSGLSSQPQDYQVAGKTAKARVRGVYAVNSTAPAFNISSALYVITASIGAVGSLNLSFSRVIGSDTVGVANPSAFTVTGDESAEFALPTSNAGYLLGIRLTGGSGTMATNSVVTVSAELLAYHA